MPWKLEKRVGIGGKHLQINMTTDVSNTPTYQAEQGTAMGERRFVRREREMAKVMQILACIDINGRENNP